VMGVVAGQCRKPAQRRSPRLVLRLRGFLNGRARHEIEIVDLSVSGCLARSEKPYDPGLILDLEIELGYERLVAKARVVESSLDGDFEGAAPVRYLVGLAFLTMPSISEYHLRMYLENERRRRLPRS
jgi:hypothetical protein